MATKTTDGNFLSENGTVIFDFMTSLQNIAMVKIVSSLWMNKSSLQHIVNFFHSDIRPQYREKSSSWQKITKDIVAKVSQLPLPKSVIEEMCNIVPDLGNSILNWIRYHEVNLNNSGHSAVDQINHIAWTARGKIDYAQTTKNILADKDNSLSNDHKYKLACINCLEDEIVVLAHKVVNQNYLDSVKIHIHPMVYFWTAQITGDNSQLYNYYRDYRRKISITGYILRLLINSNKMPYRNFNDVPIRYIWDLLSVEEKSKNITSLINELGDQEFRYTLFSSLEFEEQKKISKKLFDTMLLSILNDWLWVDYFLPFAFYFLDIMQPSAYLSILKHITKAMSKHFKVENKYLYSKYSCIFKKLWQEVCKRKFEKVSKNSVVEFVFSCQDICLDMDVTELIFKELNEEQKQSIIFDCRGIKRCAKFIKGEKWDLLDRFIKSTLSSEEDTYQLKKRILNDYWYEISEYFLTFKIKTKNKIEHFLSWACRSEEEKVELRTELAYRNCESELVSGLSENEIKFATLEKRFKWCAKGDQDMISTFKAGIAYSYSEKIIKKLIQNDNYKLLDIFLNWCFIGDRKNIIQFKSNMYKHSHLKEIFVPTTTILIKKDTSFKRLNKFVDWLFTNQQEVQKFKKWLIYPMKKRCSLCTSFLLENRFQLADKCIEWCDISVEEVKEFKKILMLSRDFEVIFENYHCKKKPYLHLLINWFSPTKELVVAFKNVYPIEKCPKDFYCLLKDFL